MQADRTDTAVLGGSAFLFKAPLTPRGASQIDDQRPQPLQSPLGRAQNDAHVAKRILPRVLFESSSSTQSHALRPVKRRFTSPGSALAQPLPRHRETSARSSSSSLPTPETTDNMMIDELHEDVLTLNTLGTGEFGTTVRQVDRGTGQQFATKRLHRVSSRDVTALADALDALSEDLQPHLHVLPIIYADVSPMDGVLRVRTPVCSGRSLAGLLSDFGPLHAALASKFTRECAEGLEFLHASGVAHGALHGGNVLVESDGCCRLADYGIRPLLMRSDSDSSESNPAHSDVRKNGWQAPELHRRDADLAAADIWAFGALILEMFAGERPDAAQMRLRGAALRAATRDCACAAALVARCASVDPQKRPSASTLDLHEFLRL